MKTENDERTSFVFFFFLRHLTDKLRRKILHELSCFFFPPFFFTQLTVPHLLRLFRLSTSQDKVRRKKEVVMMFFFFFFNLYFTNRMPDAAISLVVHHFSASFCFA